MPAYASKNSALVRLAGQIACCHKINELRTVVLDGFRQLVPYESAAFFLVNPKNMQYIDPLFRDLDRSWFKKYSDYYERLDKYKSTVFTDGIPPVDRSSDYMDYSVWGKNEHRADFLLPQGIFHLACLQIMDGANLVGEISLHRSKRQEDFSSEEMSALLILHEQINSTYSRIKVMCQRDALLDLIKVIHLQESPGFILMDRNFNIVSCNRAASAMGKGFTDHLKQEFKTAIENKVCSLSPGRNSSIFTDGIFGRSPYRSTVVTDSGGEVFLLALVDSVPEDEHNLQILNKYSLTRREREIAGLIFRGKSNEEIRNELFISENTLKTHIKQLYSKLNVKNRNELTFRLFHGR